jgi:hypothetical protein
MSRGRGRPPHLMLDEAEEIARKRGAVMMVAGGRSDSFDIIICEEHRNVFVRCRGSATPLSDVFEIIRRYDRDISRIISMPLTKVMAWEFWLREPRGKWRFFLVTHNGVLEIQADGTILYRPVLPVPFADTVKEEASPAGEEVGPDDKTPEGE